MRIEGREAIWFGIIVAALAAIFLATFLLSAYSQGYRLQSAEPTLPPKGTLVNKPSPWDSFMLQLDKEALADAYRDQLKHVFSVWMRDDSDQPRRAINGANQARRAYILVRQAIEKREKELGQRSPEEQPK
jgi:hypothetical protein